MNVPEIFVSFFGQYLFLPFLIPRSLSQQAVKKAQEAGKELEVVYVPVADSVEVRKIACGRERGATTPWLC